MLMERTTPKDWTWAYHATPEYFLLSISLEGLEPASHPSTPEIPTLFVEPDLEGIEPYYAPGIAILRFKTPGFGTTDDGETVLFGGDGAGEPPPPFMGKSGEAGAIPPERIQVMVGRRFQWLAPA